MLANYRFRRHCTNQLMMMWLKRDLKSLHVPSAVDIGCGRFINRPLFKTDNYVGVDTTEKSITIGKKLYPEAKGYVGSLLEPAPEKGDLVVCTLVLNNKRFPVERTLDGVKNLVDATKPDGHLIFTTGHVNAAFEQDIDKVLAENFKHIKKKRYGAYSKVSMLSYPIAWFMDLIPASRVSNANVMHYYHASGRKSS